mmetsp:Transcript_122/g.214  ORF Transcript_122/g.214 Transcript_122/m.214 type:complete len:461 (+) Transcript_122:183-1565(+)
MGYGVLPMAIAQTSAIACGIEKNDMNIKKKIEPNNIAETIKTIFQHSTLTIQNVVEEKYKPLMKANFWEMMFCNLMEQQTWWAYVVAGIRVIFKDYFFKDKLQAKEKLEEDIMLPVEPFTMTMAVHGNVPPGSGLSSSASIVCAATMSMVATFTKKHMMTKERVAELANKAEHDLGLINGGMDQTISICAESGTAKYIEFTPTLKATTVYLPYNAHFVVMHSLVSAEKQKTAAVQYNRRVVECRLALTLLLHHLKMLKLTEETPTQLIQLQILLGETLENMVKLVDKHLTQDVYHLDEIAKMVDTNVDTLKTTVLRGIPAIASYDNLKLKQRATHVFSEANRVLTFKQILSKEKDPLEAIGQLMNDSHASNRDLYDASCPELDELTTLARQQKGCFGARFTGAGFGGCAIALVQENAVTDFCHALWNAYYIQKTPLPTRSEVLFSSKPSRGALIQVVTSY